MNSVKYFTPKNWCADICKAQFLPSNLNFTLKTVLLSNAISSFFSRHDLYFHPAKDCRSTRPYSPFFYIYCYFGQIFCTEVIQFFSVENLGLKEPKKSSKYKLVIFWMRNGGLLLPSFCSFLFKGRP